MGGLFGKKKEEPAVLDQTKVQEAIQQNGDGQKAPDATEPSHLGQGKPKKGVHPEDDPNDPEYMIQYDRGGGKSPAKPPGEEGGKKPRKKKDRNRDDTLNLSDEMVLEGPPQDTQFLDGDIDADMKRGLKPHQYDKNELQPRETQIRGKKKDDNNITKGKPDGQDFTLPLKEDEGPLPDFTINQMEISSIYSGSEEEREEEEFQREIVNFDRRRLSVFNWGLEGSVTFRTVSFKFNYSPMHKGFRIIRNYNKFLTSKLKWRIDPSREMVKFSIIDDNCFNLASGGIDRCKGFPIKFSVGFDGKFRELTNPERVYKKFTKVARKAAAKASKGRKEIPLATGGFEEKEKANFLKDLKMNVEG